MTLRLGHLGHVQERGDLLAADDLADLRVHVDERRVVPAFHDTDLETGRATLALEPGEGG